MKIEDARKFFDSLDRDGKLLALAILAHDVTVLARDTYEVQTSGIVDPAAIRRLNEVQHRVTAAMIHLLDGSYDENYLWLWLREDLTEVEFSFSWDRIARLIAR